MVDKNQAVIDFLLNCPSIEGSPLYFNFINAEDNNKEILTFANETNLDKPYIDGSIQKRYSFTIVDYKSITSSELVKLTGYVNENVEDLVDTQSIIDWVNEQNELRNFPDFGEDCLIDEMRVTSNEPRLNGIDMAKTPALAVYNITIQVDYIDNSKKLWR